MFFFADLTPQVVRCISAYVFAALKSSISKNNSLKSAYTHEILRFTEGTFASSKDLSVTGRGFKSSLIKYLAPILYDADRSQLYLFPLHILRSHLRSSFPALYSGVSYMPIFPVTAQSRVPSGTSGSVPACGTSGLFHWDDR